MKRRVPQSLLWLDWKIMISMKHSYFWWLNHPTLLLWETRRAFLKENFPAELQWCSCTPEARRAGAAGPQADIPVGVTVVFGSEDRQQPAEEQHHQANASNAHNCKRKMHREGLGWDSCPCKHLRDSGFQSLLQYWHIWADEASICVAEKY